MSSRDRWVAIASKFGANLSIGHEGGCWVWEGRRSWNGYGRFFYCGTERAAHRVLYELIVGPIPDGHQLDHKCRNRSCVRPSHMEPVTPQVNTHRAYSGHLGRGPRGRYRRKTRG